MLAKGRDYEGRFMGTLHRTSDPGRKIHDPIGIPHYAAVARLPPSAALATDGGREGWPIPLVGVSMVKRQGATPHFLRS